MDTLIGIAILLLTFVAMEGMAYLSHRYVMHGWLWSLHASHHRRHDNAFELNDWFAVFFAVPSIILIYVGVNWAWPALWAGLGMTAYGLMYFVFHDLIVHQRIRFRLIPRFGYMRRIVQAHRLHHAVEEKHGCVSFGFLYSPPVARLREELRERR